MNVWNPFDDLAMNLILVNFKMAAGYLAQGSTGMTIYWKGIKGKFHAASTAALPQTTWKGTILYHL